MDLAATVRSATSAGLPLDGADHGIRDLVGSWVVVVVAAAVALSLALPCHGAASIRSGPTAVVVKSGASDSDPFVQALDQELRYLFQFYLDLV